MRARVCVRVCVGAYMCAFAYVRVRAFVYIDYVLAFVRVYFCTCVRARVRACAGACAGVCMSVLGVARELILLKIPSK